MPTITLKNIPDNLYKKIRLRAKQSHRSINSEIIRNLEKSVMSSKADSERILESARKIKASIKNVLSEKEITELKGNGRK